MRITEILSLGDAQEKASQLHTLVSQKTSGLTEAERVVLVVEDLEMEVNNVGFSQYIQNS